jgi:putative membrane protein
MRLLVDLAIAFVALCHIGFLVLEMFLWQRPLGRRVFGMTPEQSASTAPLAKNQGLYNGFLAAGLVWGLATGSIEVKMFFLVCIVIAGIYGAITAKRSVLYVQALPAIAALGLLLASRT